MEDFVYHLMIADAALDGQDLIAQHVKILYI